MQVNSLGFGCDHCKSAVDYYKKTGVSHEQSERVISKRVKEVKSELGVPHEKAAKVVESDMRANYAEIMETYQKSIQIPEERTSVSKFLSELKIWE